MSPVERTTPMSIPQNKISGQKYINGYMLPNINDNDLIALMFAKVDLSSVLKTKFPFEVVFTGGKVNATDNGHKFVIVEYEIFFTSNLYCPIGELLNHHYFEDLDMTDNEFAYGSELSTFGLDYKTYIFKKTKLGWERIE